MLSWLFGKKKISLPSDFRKYLDPDAVAIIKQLEDAGFETYLVGGCVRDVLLRKKPKDFDIATQATPQQVKAVIKRCFIIGKRFRIVVAKRRWRSGEIAAPTESLFPTYMDAAAEKEFQITTFRRDPIIVNGIVNENVFGSPKEDAQRRDFTLNALFLEPVNGKIVDFVGGLEDLSNKTLRVIGDPLVRFREDPIRILRALRFIARADLKMSPSTASALEKCVPLLAEAKKERIREEIVKSLKEGSAERVFREFQRFGIWKIINPEFGHFLHEHPKSAENLVKIAAKAQASPWTHARNASPLFLLLLNDVMSSGNGMAAKISVIEDHFKVSKAEKEEIHRIRHTLTRILKDPEAKQAQRLLGSDPRHHFNLASTFYAFKILADCQEVSFVASWKNWKPVWEQKITSAPAHSQQRSLSAPARRRRSPSRSGRRSGRASSAATASTSGSGSTSATTSVVASSSTLSVGRSGGSSHGGGSTSDDG